MRLLELGFSPDGVLEELRRQDQYYEYRQIGIVDKDGYAVAHTGTKTKAWTGHITGEGYLAMGNGLDSEKVVQAMSDTYLDTVNLDLDERLLRCLESGREAGGQQAMHPGTANQDRSAGLIVYEWEEYALMDLRVDAHETAIKELRRVRDEYKPYVPLYYDIRAKRPEGMPSQPEWIAQLKARGKA